MRANPPPSLPALEAGTIDTLDFTQGGWQSTSGIAGTLTGSFTGVVEPDGLIGAQDLTGFSAQLAFANGGRYACAFAGDQLRRTSASTRSTNR